MCPTTDGGEVRIYVNSDKSPKTRKTEIATRDLARVLRSKFDVKAFPNKKDGTVSVEFIPIGQVVFTTTDAAPSIYWNIPGLTKAKLNMLINKDSKKEIYEEVFKSKAEKAEWSL